MFGLHVRERTSPFHSSRVLTTSLALLAAVAMSAAIGCAGSKPKQTADNQFLTDTDEQVFIGDTVEKNYDPNVIMKRAESFFEKEEYAESIIEYQHFMELHRVHTLAPYAQYRMGESYYKMMKTIDRDISPVTMALAAFQKLLRDYPGSQWEIDAQLKVRACQTFLAQNAMFIGKFYYRREAFMAASHRFEAIIKEYQDLDEIVQESLYYLALSYSELGLGDWAKDSLIALGDRYPDNKFKSESRTLMVHLSRYPTEPTTVDSPIATNGFAAPSVSVVREPRLPVPTASTPVSSFR